MKPNRDSTPRPSHHSRLDGDVEDDLEEVQLHLSCAEVLLATLRNLHAAAEEGRDGRAIDDAVDRMSAELLEALEAVDRIRVRRSIGAYREPD